MTENLEPRELPALIRNCYQDSEGNRGKPFPSGETLGIKIPESRLICLETQAELAAYLHDPEQAGAPADADIIRIDFPGEFGCALVLPEMIPGALICAALSKIQNYMESKSNREYFCYKLFPVFKGREPFVRGLLSRLQDQPQICCAGILEGDESSYVFWAFFCNLLKNDVNSRSARLSEDIAAIQGAWIIEAANYCGKARAAERQRKENAFKELKQYFNRSPYLYTFEEILQFKSAGGTLLLNIYTRDDLMDWLKEKTTLSPDSKLPELLVIPEPGGTQRIILKTKILPVCYRSLLQTVDTLKEEALRRWETLYREYRREPAMEEDEEFNRLLRGLTEKANPLLASMLEDPRFFRICHELGQTKELAPLASRFFAKGKLLSFSAVFKLKRKNLLEELRSGLPLRYTLPIVSGLMGVLFRLLRRAGILHETQVDDYGKKFKESGE